MPSSRFFHAIAAENTSETPALLLTLEHSDFDAPIRLTDANRDLVVEGNTYKAWAMQAPAPSDGPEARQRGARIIVDNTDKWLVGQLALAATMPSARIDVALLPRTAEEAVQIEHSWTGMKLSSYAPGGGQIELELKARDDSDETFPYQTFSPGRTPGLYN